MFLDIELTAKILNIEHFISHLKGHAIETDRLGGENASKQEPRRKKKLKRNGELNKRLFYTKAEYWMNANRT